MGGNKMPGYVVHIAIAQEYLKKHNMKYSKDFIMGSVAPDFTSDKSKTHYGKSIFCYDVNYLISICYCIFIPLK